MARTYTLKRRAETQAQTRQRIVEAAVKLHGTVGPAATTLSMIAEKAGVQRHTLYAHFPDERSLSLACSGLTMERDPPPDASAWRGMKDQGERLRAGLTAIYGWFERNAQLFSCVLRDAEYHPLTKEVVEIRMAPAFASYHEVLGAKLNERQCAMLTLALSFFTWRSLVRDGGLKQSTAVAAMVQAIKTA
jgi:AcrR family transcriptional regulator